jgi:DNA-binding NarL/FixJ family response regulator
MSAPTVVLADDHPLVCNGLKAMLEPHYTVVAMVHDGHEVVGSVVRHRPDLVLMDLSLPGYNGLILTRLLKELGELPRIVVVTMHADRVYVDEALKAGADGFVLKTAKAAELRRALGEVMAGRRYVTPELRPARPGEPEGQAEPELALEGELLGVGRLTRRQRQVLELLGRGLSTQQIAATLGISVKAIEYHRSRIRQTLAITSQAALYRMAMRYAEKLVQEKVSIRPADTGPAPPQPPAATGTTRSPR